MGSREYEKKAPAKPLWSKNSGESESPTPGVSPPRTDQRDVDRLLDDLEKESKKIKDWMEYTAGLAEWSLKYKRPLPEEQKSVLRRLMEKTDRMAKLAERLKVSLAFETVIRVNQIYSLLKSLANVCRAIDGLDGTNKSEQRLLEAVRATEGLVEASKPAVDLLQAHAVKRGSQLLGKLGSIFSIVTVQVEFGLKTLKLGLKNVGGGIREKQRQISTNTRLSEIRRREREAELPRFSVAMLEDLKSPDQIGQEARARAEADAALMQRSHDLSTRIDNLKTDYLKSFRTTLMEETKREIERLAVIDDASAIVPLRRARKWWDCLSSDAGTPLEIEGISLGFFKRSITLDEAPSEINCFKNLDGDSRCPLFDDFFERHLGREAWRGGDL